MVLPGNPKNIRGFQDLTRPEVRFSNRQRGSGTRILLDYQLARLNLTADAIPGYDQEEYTHMAVAVNVLSGAADTGLGIMAAARAWAWTLSPWSQSAMTWWCRRRPGPTIGFKSCMAIIRSGDFKTRGGRPGRL